MSPSEQKAEATPHKTFGLMCLVPDKSPHTWQAPDETLPSWPYLLRAELLVFMLTVLVCVACHGDVFRTILAGSKGAKETANCRLQTENWSPARSRQFSICSFQFAISNPLLTAHPSPLTPRLGHEEPHELVDRRCFHSARVAEQVQDGLAPPLGQAAGQAGLELPLD